MSTEENTIHTKCPCFLCYGKKQNKKGKICKRCKGTGLIAEHDMNLFLNAIRDETNTGVKQNEIDIKNSMVLKIS